MKKNAFKQRSQLATFSRFLDRLDRSFARKNNREPMGGLVALCDSSGWEGRQVSVMQVNKRVNLLDRYKAIAKQIFKCINSFLRYSIPKNNVFKS